MFVNCDWGTTRLRMRVINPSPWQLLSEFRSADGVASIAAHYQGAERPPAFATILAEGLVPLAAQQGQDLAGAPILISGMTSSSIGWRELPYATLPQPVDGSQLICEEMPPVSSTVGEHRVLLISGVRSQADIMRGEETELVGLFTLPELAEHASRCTVLKPGTHSKHVQIRNGSLVDFQTHMTGELFAVLAEHSVLRHSVGDVVNAEQPVQDWDAFVGGLDHARRGTLSAALFRVRTRQVLDGLPEASNRDFLSGVLIGSELREFVDESQATPLVLAATDPMAGYYRRALEHFGLAGRLTTISPEKVELLSAHGQARLLARLGGSLSE